MKAPQRLVLIGASAGGHTAVSTVIEGLPADLDAAVLIVMHNAYEIVEGFEKVLCKNSKLPVAIAKSGDQLQAGHVYLAPANSHLAAGESEILLSNGPRENLFRPAIDVLFRSAAVSWGNKCIAVLLTGRLNDGTAGLAAIKKCGSIAIIQNPQTAEFSEMPATAQRWIEIDYTLNLEEIAECITELCKQSPPPHIAIPDHLKKEAGIAMKIGSQIGTQNSLGEQVPLSCASCGGPLWKLDEDGIERYRCHVGHSFSQEALLQEQNVKLEETLWVALRTFEEKKMLLDRMAGEYESKGFLSLARNYRHRLGETDEHIVRLRDLLQLRD